MSAAGGARLRTYLIERQELFAPYLVRLLRGVGLDVIATAADVDPRDIGTVAPAAVVIDVDYLARNGLSALCAIRSAARGACVIAFTEIEDPTFAASCVLSGASAVCSKSQSEASVRDHLGRVLAW